MRARRWATTIAADAPLVDERCVQDEHCISECISYKKQLIKEQFQGE